MEPGGGGDGFCAAASLIIDNRDCWAVSPREGPMEFVNGVGGGGLSDVLSATNIVWVCHY